MNQQAIDAKIASIHAQIVQQHPRSCKSCMGRGGRVIPSWEGCYETILCKECVLNGLDPLDMTKELIPFDYEGEYGSEYIEECIADGYDPRDPASYEEDEIHQYYGDCKSPTNGENIKYGSWGLASKIQSLLMLKHDLKDLEETYNQLLEEGE